MDSLALFVIVKQLLHCFLFLFDTAKIGKADILSNNL